MRRSKLGTARTRFDAPATCTLRVSDLHSAQSVIFNGHVYKSLGSHDPHSTQVIDEDNKLYDLDPAWHICSPTPDALHVCAAYPWAAYALVFADGSAYYTSNGPKTDASHTIGKSQHAVAI